MTRGLISQTKRNSRHIKDDSKGSSERTPWNISVNELNSVRAYNEDYYEGQRYCQNALCSNHMYTNHFATMKKLDDFLFCSYDCMSSFYARNKIFFIKTDYQKAYGPVINSWSKR